VEVGRKQLGFVTGPRMRVVVGDGRVTLRDQPVGAHDIVIVDAFGGEAAPWHLSTKEFLLDVKSRLKPGGVYALNIIDGPTFGFVRAEINTLRKVYDNVMFITNSEAMAGRAAANFVVVASDRPLPMSAIEATQENRSAELVVVSGAELDRFVGDAIVLTDNFAPADQLFNP
jgi:spermidine synthase